MVARKSNEDDELEANSTASAVPDSIIQALDRLGRRANAAIGNTSSTGPMPSNPAEDDVRLIQRHLKMLHKRMDELLKPLEFKSKPGRKLVIFKLGSSTNGWVPNPMHFDRVRRVLKAGAYDESFNILLMHYGISTETVES